MKEITSHTAGISRTMLRYPDAVIPILLENTDDNYVFELKYGKTVATLYFTLGFDGEVQEAKLYACGKMKTLATDNHLEELCEFVLVKYHTSDIC